MKKLVLICFALLISGCTTANQEPTPTEETTATSGEVETYVGIGKGHGGEIQIEMSVQDNQITDLVVLTQNETLGMGDVAQEKIFTHVLDHQSLSIDNVSGATLSTIGYRTAILDAANQSTLDVETMKEVEVMISAEDVVMQADVVIVGSGAAGLSAAISAAQNGASVIVLEKLDRLGGSTITSSGLIYAGGTTLQEEAGIEDSADALEAYWKERAEGVADEAYIELVAQESQNNIDFLIESGVGYNSQTILQAGLDATPRSHLPSGLGASMINELASTARELGVEIITSTDVQEITVNDEGVVNGVSAQQDYNALTVESSTVILATGGYGNNPEMLAQYAPIATGDFPTSAPGSEGDGIVMAQSLGAQTEFPNGVIGWKIISPGLNHTTPIGSLANKTRGIIVDETGLRFTNEAADYPFVHRDMCENGSEQFYFLYSSNVPANSTSEDHSALIELLESGIELGVVSKAESIDELATTLGMSELVSSVERYNTLENEDTDFNKGVEFMTPISEGPYYALTLEPSLLGTFGGIVTNLDAQVLNTQGEVIEGLYAAGEVANSEFFGELYPASGSAIAHAVTFGRVAGENAALTSKE